MLSSFESISQGLSQSPRGYPQVEEIFKRNVVMFFKHAISSIPYRRENEMRIDIALSQFAKQHSEPLSMWGISSAD